MLTCLARVTVAGDNRPLMTPLLTPFQESHCRAIPSCVSNPLVSTMLPLASGTLYSLPSVSTPSTSIRSKRTLDASSVIEEDMGYFEFRTARAKERDPI